MSLVSVIIPNYNHGKYLHQRIQSVLAQTYQDFEIIILDDKSTDNSCEIINTYKSNSKVSHIVFNDVNSGSTFKQWEKGINLSKGEYIWIAESDDFSEHEFLKVMVKSLSSHPSCCLAFSNSTYINGEGEHIYSDPEAVDAIWRHNISLNKEDALKQFIWHTQIVNASSVLFRKKAYSSIKSNEYTKFKLCGDWLFWIQLLEIGGLVYECKKLNYFRQHEKSVRSSSIYNNIDILESIKIFEYFINNHYSLIGKSALKKVKEKLKYRLYVVFCLVARRKSVSNIGLVTKKSFSHFPSLPFAIAQLIFARISNRIISAVWGDS